MFFDEAKIYVQAGSGGNGCVAFRREKGVPMGGPSGGNGGRGGDVIIRATRRKNTLSYLENRNQFKAERGQHGQGKDLYGRNGESVVIEAPLGTVVRDADSGRVLADMIAEGQEVCVAHGGRGGRGNATFATPTNQAPRISEKGEPGQTRWLNLELRLIADVGIVGLPNAGKSTLLAAVSKARPKIAPYPFTTIQPNLGVISLGYEVEFVMADLPGLIEGASQGVGLGHKFLRHVERTRLLLHLLDGASEDPLRDYDMINRELAAFSPALSAKPQMVVLNKLDVPSARERLPLLREQMAAQGIVLWSISAATGENVRQVLNEVVRRLNELPAEIPTLAVEPEPEVDEKAFTLTPEEGGWHVHGIEIERVAAMTNWEQEESTARFQRVLEALGITMALREAGIEDGDTVWIGSHELEWGWSPYRNL